MDDGFEVRGFTVVSGPLSTRSRWAALYASPSLLGTLGAVPRELPNGPEAQQGLLPVWFRAAYTRFHARTPTHATPHTATRRTMPRLLVLRACSGLKRVRPCDGFRVANVTRQVQQI